MKNLYFTSFLLKYEGYKSKNYINKHLKCEKSSYIKKKYIKLQLKSEILKRRILTHNFNITNKVIQLLLRRKL